MMIMWGKGGQGVSKQKESQVGVYWNNRILCSL